MVWPRHVLARQKVFSRTLRQQVKEKRKTFFFQRFGHGRDISYILRMDEVFSLSRPTFRLAAPPLFMISPSP